MIFFTLVLACKDPVDADEITIEDGNAEAPSDLNGLTAFMFREWDNEDSSVLAAGLENIEAMSKEFSVTIDVAAADRGVEDIDALTADDVADVTLNHGYDPEGATGVGLFLQSNFSVDDHVGVFTLTDQTVVEPASPVYNRTITDGGDCFPSKGCDTMRAENEVERKNIVVDTEQETIKVWRWVEMSDGRMAVAGRTWQPDLADSEKEDKIYQNYSIEVWIPNDDGALRFITTWSENSFEFADVLIIGSINDAYEACEEYLGE